MWVRLLLSPLVLVLGCSELPADQAGTAGPCSSETLRIAAVHLPASGSEAAALGFDLDGDRTIDNQLGALSAALGAVYAEWAPDRWLDDRLADREVSWLVRLERCEGDRAWNARLAEGADVDHDGRPELVDDGAPASGDGTVASGGAGRVPVGYFADGGGLAEGPAWEDAPALSVSARDGADGAIVVTLGVSVPLGDAALAPAAAFLTAELARGSRFAAGIDRDGNRTISVAELRGSPAVSSLLAADVDADEDGTAEGLSLGFSATAVAVTLDD